jgi:hypothetical protein
VATLERELREQDARLASIGADDELCIWAGPEWFCQSVLLALLGRAIRRVKTRNLSLVQGPMEPTGCSLAHLDDAALRALFAARTPIEAPVLAVAHRAWTAFCSSEPDDIVSLLGDDWPSLPHLREGLVRHLQELPDAASGLGRTEEEVLEAVRAGAGTDPEILKAVAAREEQPWLTDVMLRRLLQRMARGALPLLVDGAPVSLTPRGHAVLEGVERYVERRAVGGVIVDDPNASPLAP